ncbi:MAG: radical SAM protein [Candidatus Aminicenantes bacterium]|nr:radical SAM protein [Candidatus Aminicenantes bacterium]
MTISRYKTIFGPVPSRRLGVSLGIDIIPFKTCTYNCVYCECGATTDLTLERKPYVDAETVLLELEQSLSNLDHVDYITFSGSGEPTLNMDLGRMIVDIKQLTKIPIAVLTNGSLMYREDVVRDLLPADVILPSLDAVSTKLFSRINRPHSKLKISQIIGGLLNFRQRYPGKIWLEIFIVKGINDGGDELNNLYCVIKKINPDRAQLNSLDRPPTDSSVKPVDMKVLENIKNGWVDIPVEIIKRIRKREEIAAFSKNLENSIIDTISRRPLNIEDLVQLTGKNKLEIFKYIDVLEREKKIYSEIVGDKIYYVSVK